MQVIELATHELPDAFITAHSDGLSLEGTAAPRLRARLWCGPTDACETWWQIEVVDGSAIVASADGEQINDGAGAEVDLDLGSAPGNTVRVPCA